MRRIAFVRASQSVGIPLALIREVLAFDECQLVNPDDALAARGPGAHLLEATPAGRRKRGG